MIDHIVYAVSELENGIHQIHQKLGAKPVYGGRHLHQGTHNALLKLGNGCYFEIIAPDPENKNIKAPRWMGVDLIKEPCITRWAIKSSDISADIRHISALKSGLGESKEGQRMTDTHKLLKWHLSIPQPSPLVEPIPFLIDWEYSEHPSECLPDICRIESFNLYSDKAEELNQALSALGIKQYASQSDEASIQLTVRCPNGLVKL